MSQNDGGQIFPEKLCEIGKCFFAGSESGAGHDKSPRLRYSQNPRLFADDGPELGGKARRPRAHYPRLQAINPAMPYWREGDPKPGWMRRREWRERVSHRLFGHGVETMIGVGAVVVGGLFGGMTIVSIARDGFDFERVAGGVALSVIPIWFGLFFFPKRRDH